jgi:uncharacterized membrane protein YphA (DoxX/SURF4 family)
MFPARMAGAALLVMRLSVGVPLVVHVAAYQALTPPFWAVSGAVLVAIFLCLGLLTPYCAALNCLIELGILIFNGGESGFPLVIAAVNSGVLAVLGPGAYSVDARFFGRRILTVPPRR